MDPSETPEQRFWRWFKGEEASLGAFDPVADPEGADEILDRVLERLADVQAGLTCEIGPTREDGRREFIISADGIRERFPAVRRLALAAPPLKHWKPVAFRPRQEIGYTVNIDGFILDPDHVWFRAAPKGSQVELDLYVKDFSAHPRNTVLRAGYVLLDSALGELDVETKVAGIGWHDLPADPALKGLTAFALLPEVVDRLVPGPPRGA